MLSGTNSFTSKTSDTTSHKLFLNLFMNIVFTSVGNWSLKWGLINRYLWPIDHWIRISNLEIQKWYILAHKMGLPSINKQYFLFFSDTDSKSMFQKWHRFDDWKILSDRLIDFLSNRTTTSIYQPKAQCQDLF